MTSYTKKLLTLAVVASLQVFSSSTCLAQASNMPEAKAAEYYQASEKARQEKRYADAAELLVKLHEMKLPSYGSSLSYNIACLQALAGAKDAAFSWLDLTIKAGYGNIEHMAKDSDFISLHEDPRWQAMLTNAKKEVTRQARLWNSPAWNIAYTTQLSEDEKVAGLSKFWSEVKYNFVYTDKLLDLDWDAVYLRYLPKVKASKSTAEYYKILMEMCALLQDGHTSVSPPSDLFKTAWGTAPFRAALMEDKVIITEVLDPALRERGLLPGHQIISVDGQDIKSYVQKEEAPYISASTAQDMNTRMYNYFLLFGPLDTSVRLLASDAQGKQVALDVKRLSSPEKSKLGTPKPAFEWRMLDNNIAYVALNSFGDDTAAKEYIKAFPEIAKAQGIIFDVRKNGGGNSSVGHRILQTLGGSSFVPGQSMTRDYKPTNRAWGERPAMFTYPERQIKPDPERAYHGKVMVLTSAATYSAAEDFALAFDLMKRGLIIGEPTGGSTGQPLLFSLPGGGSARVCTKKDTYPDGKAFVGVGVQVNKLVPTRVADFRAGKDTQLEAALQEIKTMK